MHYTPPFLDAVSGASKRVSSGEDALDGSYIFVMNTRAAGLADAENRRLVESAVMNRKQRKETGADNIAFTLYVSETEPALIRYAGELSERLKDDGINVIVKVYSRIMLRSRIFAGKYEAFLSTRGFIEAEALEHSEYFTLDAEDMDG